MSDEPHIPDDLKHALRARFAPPAVVPDAADQAVLRGARAHLLRRRPWRAVIGAAAALLLAGTVLWMGMPKAPAVNTQMTMDINQDQQINILDALKLARQGGRAGEGTSRQEVSDDAIRAIAMASVALESRP